MFTSIISAMSGTYGVRDSEGLSASQWRDKPDEATQESVLRDTRSHFQVTRGLQDRTGRGGRRSEEGRERSEARDLTNGQKQSIEFPLLLLTWDSLWIRSSQMPHSSSDFQFFLKVISEVVSQIVELCASLRCAAVRSIKE